MITMSNNVLMTIEHAGSKYPHVNRRCRWFDPMTRFVVVHTVAYQENIECSLLIMSKGLCDPYFNVS